MFPRLPRVLRAQKHAPLTLPAPLVGMPSSHVAISDVRSCVPRAPFVAVLRVLASPSATPKCLSGTSTWGTAAATRSHDFQVRNSFPECNTPLISAHGALSSTPCCRLIEGFGRVCAVTSIVDCSVRSIESIDGRYGGCWRRSSPKPPSHKPRRRLNSSSTPGPVDCARAVWRKRYPGWVPFGAAPPQVTPPPPPPDNPLQTAPSLFARYDDARESPLARARCGGGGARSLARSRARCVAVAMAFGYTARHARYARRASRALTRTSSPRIARVVTVFRSPSTHACARCALRRRSLLARSLLARARAVWRWRWRWRSVTSRVTRVTRARARHRRASRASSPPPFPGRHPYARAAAAAALSRLLACSRARRRRRWGWGRRSVTSRVTRIKHVTCAARHARVRAYHHRFARVITVFRPPRARPARARCCGGGARSLARARAVWRWRWRWRSVTSRVMRARHARHARARARHRRASRASSPPPFPDVTHARARQRRRRCLVCSLARARGGGGGGVGGGGRLHRASRVSNTSRASLVTRAHAHIITASRASSPFSVPPAHDRHARAAAAAVLARSLARVRCGVGVGGGGGGGVQLHRASRASRARACTSSPRIARVITAPLPRCHPCARAAAVAALSRLLASSRAWRRRWTVIRTSCVPRASRARARASSSSRHLLAPLPLKCAPFTAVSSSLLSSLSSSLSSSLRARITTKRPATCE